MIVGRGWPKMLNQHQYSARHSVPRSAPKLHILPNAIGWMTSTQMTY